MLEKVSLPQLPYVSTANGMQDQPNSWYLGPLKWRNMAGQRGDVMVMSNAAGLSLSNPAMWISAGLVWSRSMAFLHTNTHVGTTMEVKHLIPQAIVAYDHPQVTALCPRG